jgi:hypothetical protein
MRSRLASLTSLLLLPFLAVATSALGVPGGNALGQAAPQDTTLPSIAGSPAPAQTLSADPGVWAGPNPTFAFQWNRCDASGSNCSPISGATAQAYVSSRSDVSSTLRVTVTATNKNGSAIATSAATGVVTAAVAAPVPAPQTTTTTSSTTTSSQTSTTTPTTTSTTSATTTTTTTPTAAPFFNGNFDTGNFSQYAYLGDAHGASVQSAVTDGSADALRCDMSNVADSSVGGDLCQVSRLYQESWQANGADTWYHARVMFPAGSFLPQGSAGWNMIFEWHEPGGFPGSPYLGVQGWGCGNVTTSCANPNASLLFRWWGGTAASSALHWAKDVDANGNVVPLQYGHWYDWTWHVKWSTDPTVGYVQWWSDGRQVVPPANGKDIYGNPWPAHYQTMFAQADGTPAPDDFRVGYYRGTQAYPETLFVDSVKVGPTMASVQ